MYPMSYLYPHGLFHVGVRNFNCPRAFIRPTAESAATLAIVQKYWLMHTYPHTPPDFRRSIAWQGTFQGVAKSIATSVGGSIITAAKSGGLKGTAGEGFTVTKISSDGREFLWHKKVSDFILLGLNNTLLATKRSVQRRLEGVQVTPKKSTNFVPSKNLFISRHIHKAHGVGTSVFCSMRGTRSG